MDESDICWSLEHDLDLNGIGAVVHQANKIILIEIFFPKFKQATQELAARYLARNDLNDYQVQIISIG